MKQDRQSENMHIALWYKLLTSKMIRKIVDFA